MATYDDFQKLVIEDIPAVFLYNPLYIHGQTKKIKGSNGKLISLPSSPWVAALNAAISKFKSQ